MSETIEAQFAGGSDKGNVEDGTPAVERPEYIPEKFWTGDVDESVKKMSQSYVELEKKLSAPKAAKQEETPPATIESPKAPELLREIMEAVNAGTEVDDAKLKQYADLTGVHPRELIRARELAAQARRTSAEDAVGGAEVLEAAIEWAKTNYTEGEIEAYNHAINGADDDAARAAVLNLAARYRTGGGSVVGNARPVQTGAKPFSSQDEMLKLQRDPRYKTDKAFQAEFDARLRASL